MYNFFVIFVFEALKHRNHGIYIKGKPAKYSKVLA